MLESIFSALCEGAALNPDADAEEEEGAGDFFFDEGEVRAGADAAAAARLARFDAMLDEGAGGGDALDSLLAADPARFEDDDEEEGEEEAAPKKAGGADAMDH